MSRDQRGSYTLHRTNSEVRDRAPMLHGSADTARHPFVCRLCDAPQSEDGQMDQVQCDPNHLRFW